MKLSKCEPYVPNPVGPRPVATFVRFSPTSRFDHECIKVDRDTNTVNIECTASTGKFLCAKTATASRLAPMANTLDRKFLSFTATHVFYNASQDDFFHMAMADLVDKALNGFSGTVIACGSVGAGKTYTLFSPNEKYPYRGVVVRCIEKIFGQKDEWDERSAAISMSFVEVLGESIVDLLSPEKKPVTIVDGGNTFRFDGMSTERVLSAEAALVALFRGCAQRTAQRHPRNSGDYGSSTAHAVFTLKIESRSLVETEPFDRYAELTFVDFAGFEKIRSWEQGTTERGPRSFVDVNKSTSYLEQFIMALSEKRSYLPVRVSRLTHLLKNKIGNKVDTRLIACTSGEQCHLAETLATLRFAVRLRGVICSPQEETVDDPNLLLANLKKDVAGLKSELYMQDMIARRAPKMHGELSHKDRSIIREQVQLYLDDELDSIPIVSVKQIESVLEFVKVIQLEREAALREQITSEMQQQAQQQLEQLQQQLMAGVQQQQPAAQEQRPSTQPHGRERSYKRRLSRQRLNRESTDDDRTTETRSRKDERQMSAGAASVDQSGPGFGVGTAEGRPNAAAVAMSSRARSRGGGGRGGAGAGGAASERTTASPTSAAPEEGTMEEVEVPAPTEPEPTSSQEALRLLVAAGGDSAQLQADVEQLQRTVTERHQLYSQLARSLREMRCQQAGLQTDLQLAQTERHVQGERYDADGSLMLSSDERQLSQQLRQLSSQLSDTRDRLGAIQRQLVDSQRQLAVKKAELASALAVFQLKNNVVTAQPSSDKDADKIGKDKDAGSSTKGVAVARNDEGSASMQLSAAVQVPSPHTGGTPDVYYSAQRKARLMMRRSRCSK